MNSTSDTFGFWHQLALRVVLLPAVLCHSFTADAQSADPGWPRVFKQGDKQLTVYQPQVDYWKDYSKIHFRCAIAVKGVLKQEKFGVAEVDAVTVTDQADRIVVIGSTQRDLRFPNVSDDDLAALRGAVDQLRPMGQATTLSLDRVIAFAFGLLHGFGFASALNQLGLPQNGIPVALLFFNLGVEVGQLLFIAALLGLMALARWINRRAAIPRTEWLWRVAPYGIGGVAAFWVIQRIAAF